MKKLILLLLLLFSFSIQAQGFDFGDLDDDYTDYASKPKDDCRTPFTECWCETRPNNPFCKDTPAAPIDNNTAIFILIVAGLGLRLYKI